MGDPLLMHPPEIANWHYYTVGAVDEHIILSYYGSCCNCVTLFSPFSGKTRRIILHPTGLPDGELRVNLVRILPESDLVVARSYENSLFVARLGHYKWVDLHVTVVSDFISHKGELFCIRDEGTIFSFNIQQLLDNPLIAKKKLVTYDIIGCSIIDLNPIDDIIGSSIDLLRSLGCSASPLSINRFDYSSYNLVESEGELLVITSWGLKSRSLNDNDRIKFNVKRLDFQNECIISGFPYVPLVEVYDLKNKFLFIKEANSMSYPGATKESSDFWTNNCIYFINKEHNKKGEYSVGKFCMEGVEIDSSVAIFHPRQIVSFIPPFWITHPSNRRRSLHSALLTLPTV